jgi:hypothetical protein
MKLHFRPLIDERFLIAYMCTGLPVKAPEDGRESFYHWVQAPYWDKLDKQREEIAATRDKFAGERASIYVLQK